MNFERALLQKIEAIETAMLQYLTPQYPETIYTAMRYSILAGGKRIRPVLLLAVCELFGGQTKAALPFACALEMIHTYSLIHDDLPAMDDDGYRRGKPTNHKVFGEAVAILAGDGLLNLAYEIMAEQCEKSFEFRNIQAMTVIAKAAGVTGMIGGQTADVLNAQENADADTLFYIHQHKTGKLIQSAMLAGAILGGADKPALDTIGTLGEKIGFAFQIKDDILDVTGSLEQLGKTVHADERGHKTTYVSVYGLAKAENEYRRLCEEIAADIRQLSGDTGFLIYLAARLTGREN